MQPWQQQLVPMAVPFQFEVYFVFNIFYLCSCSLVLYLWHVQCFVLNVQTQLTETQAFLKTKKAWVVIHCEYCRECTSVMTHGSVTQRSLTIICLMLVCSSLSRAALWSLWTISTRMSFLTLPAPLRPEERERRSGWLEEAADASFCNLPCPSMC